MKKSLLLMALCLVIFAVSPFAQAAESASVREITVYAERLTDAEKSLYAKFTEKTGVAISVVEAATSDLIKKLGDEGQATRADILTMVDGGLLHQAKKAGVLQPLPAGFAADVPAGLRDKNSYWVGLSTRARVIVYSADRVDVKELGDYEVLADPKWKGRVVMRPGSALYNQSLLASMIAIDGEQATAEFVKGLSANFSRPPKGGDRDQAKDIAAGIADLTLMNTYYIGRMLTSSDAEELEAAKKVGVFFPNQDCTGTHINVRGIALTRHSDNKDDALKLIEFMTGVAAQEEIAATAFEYPANPKAKKGDFLESLGEFKAQAIDFSVLDDNKDAAARIAAENGWE